MGEAHITKKRVLGKVEACVSATNENIQATQELLATHNALVERVDTEFKARDQRLQSQGEWIEQVEGTADAAHALAKQLDERLRDLSVDYAHLYACVRIFIGLRFWARVRYALLGYKSVGFPDRKPGAVSPDAYVFPPVADLQNITRRAFHHIRGEVPPV